ncbi:hypothetical protein MY10362_008002, partial [Beauveria mimosiformis]
MGQHSTTSNASSVLATTLNVEDAALGGASNATPASDVPIAICGMGMKLPGGITNDSELFDFLMKKQHARSEVPQDRFNADAYYRDIPRSGTLATKYGYFLQNVNLKNLDISMFTMTEEEARAVDPNQRLLLEVVREAFESAGEASFRGASIGTYSATYSEDWQSLKNTDFSDLNPYQATGHQDFMLSNRIAWEYDLRGPSMTIKTACSSSGVALHQALQSIRLGDADGAVVTGTSIFLDPRLSIYMSSSMTLSPDGFCKTFDSAANGFGRAEGVSCVYIKRLDKAIADGNPIRAIIRASASNSDGRGPGRGVPNPAAHEALIRQAYRSAGLKLSDTAMVECHGTGTAVGDPREVAAIARCFGGRGVYLGSVKSNLGHSEGASFLTGLFKAVLSLERQTILPNVNFVLPNPAIPWEEAKLKVAIEPTPWPTNCKEQMSVNGFGIGGSNVHVVLESARAYGVTTTASPQSLKVMVQDYKKYLEKFPGRLASVALNLETRREWLKYRTVCISDTSGTFHPITPISPKTREKKGVAFIFTGQGAHWVHMGRELMKSQPLFAETIREVDQVLIGLNHAPTWNVQEILLTCQDDKVLGQPQVSHPLCTALQVALVKLLASWGVGPSASVGHSGGEIAAAHAAGALSLRDAIATAFYRGYVCEQLQMQGGMAAVALGAKEAKQYLKLGTVVACDNSPKNVTLSGDVEALDDVLEAIQRDNPDLVVKRLQVKQGYHSHHMCHVGGAYHDLLAKVIEPQTPKIPFFSSVYSRLVSEAKDFGPTYWKHNLENPVLFQQAITLLLDSCPDIGVHLEIGPHAALGSPLRQTYSEKKSSTLYIPVLVRNKDDNDMFLDAVAQLYCAGVHISQPRAEIGTGVVLTDLPRYPWHYDKEYWDESRAASAWRFPSHPPHDLLGLRTANSSNLEARWRNQLRVVDVPWMLDHYIGGNVVLPAAAYIAMAGEAARQLMDIVTTCTDPAHRTSYTVRDLQLTNAMLLGNDTVTEVITSLRPKQLTIALNSSWYEFCITSFNGHTWTKHCKGLVIASPSVTSLHNEHNVVQRFTRSISTSRWYKTLRKLGYQFGPRFSALHNMTASVSEHKASADIIDSVEAGESAYSMHPATIDALFQILAVAQVQGTYRKLNNLSMPIFIAEVSVDPAPLQTIHCYAEIQSADCCKSYGTSNGKIVIRVSGLQSQGVGIEFANEHASLTTQVLQWKPAFEFSNVRSLMVRKVDLKTSLTIGERLFVLCTSELYPILDQLQPVQPHFSKYIAWLKGQYRRFQEPDYPLISDAADIVKMTSAQRRGAMIDCLQQAQGEQMQQMVTRIWQCFSQMADILEGRVDFLKLLLKDDVLEGIYNCMSRIVDLGGMFARLGSSQPAQRILEVGAGTGSLTATALQGLRSDFGERLYSSYTYTDISPGFFVKAQERFKDFEAIEYKVLDISKDPQEQGFEQGAYDLIIASNVLHATPVLADTLRHCRKLLRPQGRLFLQEMSPVVKNTSFIMETKRLLEEQGYKTHHAAWRSTSSLPQNHGIVSFVDLDTDKGPLLKDVAEEDLRKLLLLVHSLAGTGILWLSGSAQVGCSDPHYGQILGLARAIRTELAIPFATMELDRTDITAADAICSVVKKLHRDQRMEADTSPDQEFVWADNQIYTSRLHWISRAKSLVDSVAASNSICLVVEKPGLLQSLQWRTVPEAPLEHGDVRVRMKTFGVNFRDLMVTLGTIPGEILTDGTTAVPSIEGIGYITQVGSQVNDLHVGDRVAVMPLGVITEPVIPAGRCIRISNKFSDDEAATMLAVYITALWCLVRKANLKRGQSVLIHNAAGGVGVAAIHVAQWLGAEIFATTSNEEKVEFLMEELSIPRHRIFQSRDASFHADVMRVTHGQGVDVVLSALSGELLHASWKCVAAYGIMIDIGKRDALGHGQLEMSQFARNCTFTCFDGAQLMLEGGKGLPSVREILQQVFDLADAGHIKPIHPISVFGMAEIDDAYRYMQQGQHMGKIVIRATEAEQQGLQPTAMLPLPFFRPDASYLLVGGMGGLGKAIASWMVDYGAKSIIFLSRSAGQSEEDKALQAELEEAGCSIQCYSGDVADGATVASVITKARLPIAGAMQLAMVLKDVAARDMDIDSWTSVARPRVQGTWNLHQHLPDTLDFFILFSSIGGIFGYPGQANYNSTCSFLDAFVQYRHSLGKVASVIDVGPIDDVGHLASAAATGNKILSFATRVSEQEFLDTVHLAMTTLPAHQLGDKFLNRQQLIQFPWMTLPMADTNSSMLWSHDPRISLYRNLESAPREGVVDDESKRVRKYVQELAVDPRRFNDEETLLYFAQIIRRRVATFVMKDEDELDLAMDLAAVGVDSLVAIELRNWWAQSFG